MVKVSRPVKMMLGGALLLVVGGWAAVSYLNWNQDGTGSGDLTARHREIRRLLQEGQNAYEAEDWEEVVRCYRRVIDFDPDHSSAWMHLAYGLHRLQRWDEAIAALHECARFSPVKRWALFNLATINARQGDKSEALHYLELAIVEGFQPTRPLTEEPSFKDLLDDPKFLAILEKAKPLSERMIGRQLEFLLGDWDIINKSENMVGRIRYESEVEGFVLRAHIELDENRTASVHYYFEPTSGKWVRTEVDSDGTLYRCEGSFRPNGRQRTTLMTLVLRGERISIEGKRQSCRVTITPRTSQRITVAVETKDDSQRRWQADKMMFLVRPTALSINR